jgi:hypothetical protein
MEHQEQDEAFDKQMAALKVTDNIYRMWAVKTTPTPAVVYFMGQQSAAERKRITDQVADKLPEHRGVDLGVAMVDTPKYLINLFHDDDGARAYAAATTAIDATIYEMFAPGGKPEKPSSVVDFGYMVFLPPPPDHIAAFAAKHMDIAQSVSHNLRRQGYEDVEAWKLDIPNVPIAVFYTDTLADANRMVKFSQSAADLMQDIIDRTKSEKDA